MSKWNSFLNSLATRGGAIFLLTLIFAISVGVDIHLIHHGESNGPLAASLISTFAGFSGALLMALKGGSDSTATASITPGGGATASAGDATAKPATATATPEVKT